MGEDGSTLVEYKDYQVSKDVEVEAILDPGMYVIVPKTTGCLFPRLQNRKPYPFKDDLVYLRRGKEQHHSSFNILCEDIFR